jgi:hypothetical protein
VEISAPCSRLEGNLKDSLWDIGMLLADCFQMLSLSGDAIGSETRGMEPTFTFPTKSLLLYIRVPQGSARL